MKLSKKEADVIFHALNNLHSKSLEDAIECGEKCDRLSRGVFLATKNDLLRRLMNEVPEE